MSKCSLLKKTGLHTFLTDEVMRGVARLREPQEGRLLRHCDTSALSRAARLPGVPPKVVHHLP